MKKYNYFKDPMAWVCAAFCLAGSIAFGVYWSWIAAGIYAVIVIGIFIYGRTNP